MHKFFSSFLLALFLLVSPSSSFVFAEESMQAVEAEKSQLQTQLQQIEAQIAQFQKDLVYIKGEKNTLQNKIKQLQKEQATLALRIKQTALEVEEMDEQIVATKSLIERNQLRTETLKAELAELLRQMNKNDQRTLLFVLFSEHDLFDALSEIQQFAHVTSGLDVLIDQLHKTREDLGVQKNRLDAEQDHVEKLSSIAFRFKKTSRSNSHATLSIARRWKTNHLWSGGGDCAMGFCADRCARVVSACSAHTRI